MDWNPYAYGAHSRNLVGHASASSCVEAVTLVLYKYIYSFLSSSSYRWKLLNNVLAKSTDGSNIVHVVKSLTETR